MKALNLVSDKSENNPEDQTNHPKIVIKVIYYMSVH